MPVLPAAPAIEMVNGRRKDEWPRFCRGAIQITWCDAAHTASLRKAS
jgi:hypothetical protein